MIATGATLNLNAHEQEIGSYVRAEVQGESGILYTQPFRIACEEKPVTPEEISNILIGPPCYAGWRTACSALWRISMKKTGSSTR
uniref:hypothetical protein n=1 Tax=Candidatus Fimivicinus sp. TaxID=3056640 RepID=UPI003FF138B2